MQCSTDVEFGTGSRRIRSPSCPTRIAATFSPLPQESQRWQR
jgi:hypothetical protein